MTRRIGVDIGGTFTDLIYVDDASGDLIVLKGPTDSKSPETGVTKLAAAAVPEAKLQSTDYFLHGTTVGLNALLERRGARVGLLATRGFRDVLEIRRGERDDLYDVRWKPPPPLVPRRLRLPVTERIAHDGSVLVPLDAGDVAEAAAAFAAEEVESVAIVFLHSYANPRHELEAERLLRAAGFRGGVSLSHLVSGEYREYERTSTTVLDAYVRPPVADYLDRLDQNLRGIGFGGSSFITLSSGGATTFRDAARKPFATIMSGPVAGATAAVELCTALDVRHAITADVGGTSFDTCLIRDKRLPTKYEANILGMPIQASWTDVRSIGAGGGSIAFVDGGGHLQVGPESAGSLPGPACYGRGGTRPTVTDAAAILGMLAFGELAGGIRIDRSMAMTAMAPFASELAMTPEQVALGVMAIATANMANAIRSVTVEQGYDPRDAALIAFGGAGPLFATQLASDLGVETTVIPPHPGGFSAWGLLTQDIVDSTSTTFVARLDRSGFDRARTAMHALFQALHDRWPAEHRGPSGRAELIEESALDLRYAGQEYSLTVQINDIKGDALMASAAVAERFTHEYMRTFGHSMDEEIEIVAVRASLRRSLPRPGFRLGSADGSQAAPREVSAYSLYSHHQVTFKVVERASLRAGEQFSGPTIVLEPTATTYVDAGFSVVVHATGSLLLRAAGR